MNDNAIEDHLSPSLMDIPMQYDALAITVSHRTRRDRGQDAGINEMHFR
jgi:hypothetical protein